MEWVGILEHKAEKSHTSADYCFQNTIITNNAQVQWQNQLSLPALHQEKSRIGTCPK